MENDTWVVGLDIGGTKLLAGVLNKKGDIAATAKLPTKAATGFENGRKRIVEVIRSAVAAAGMTMEKISAIGVGSPGPLDLAKGTVIETPNLKWKNAPVRGVIEDAFGKPVKIDNDVNAGTLGEFTFGAGIGAQHVIGLFVGTGLGGGVIINGKLLHGFNQNAAEFGHVIINPKGPKCGCGVKGHLEAYVAKSGIERKLRKYIQRGKDTSLASILANGKQPLKSSVIAKAYKNNDKIVVKTINRSAEYLGYAVANFLNIFNPEIVILGGGLVEAFGDMYVTRVTKVATANVFPVALRNVQIAKAQLGDNAGILGASVLAFEALG
ncbi:ROK family protein [candidate division KSB1 bacterium]|nr:ROK family protein [candidate division KSB1 bacterium]